MVEINDVNFEIEIKEVFSFEYHALPKYDEIKNEVSDMIEDIEDIEDENTLESINEFLEHELTDADKLSILEFIKNDYEFESCNPEYEVSIFDEDIIRKSIIDWIEDQFNFRPDEL
jgi:predicted RND superfamily exporter protein